MSVKAVSDGTQWGWYGSAGVLTPPTPPPPPWVPLLNVDFGSVAAGAMTGTKFRTLFSDPTQPSSYAGYNQMSMVDGGVRNQVCRIDFHAGLGNGSTPVAENITTITKLDFSPYPGGFAVAKDRAIRMTDWMLIPTTYEFPPAEKTPGLGGNIGAATDGQASGGKGLDAEMIEALSCRVMMSSAPGGNWSAGVPGFTSQITGRHNRIHMYPYYYGMGQAFGVDNWGPDPAGTNGAWPSTLTGTGTAQRAWGDGVWHKRQLVMVPNTFSGGVWHADGKVRFYLDDVLMHTSNTMLWRSNANLWVNKYWFHHFYGGSGNAYASPQDQHYFYDGPIVEAALFDGWTAD